LANAKARFLGKDGLLTQRMKALGKLSPQERSIAGRELNEAKQAVESLVGVREQQIEQS